MKAMDANDGGWQHKRSTLRAGKADTHKRQTAGGAKSAYDGASERVEERWVTAPIECTAPTGGASDGWMDQMDGWVGG